MEFTQIIKLKKQVDKSRQNKNKQKCVILTTTKAIINCKIYKKDDMEKFKENIYA